MDDAPRELVLTNPIVPVCFICRTDPPTYNHPFEPFESLRFGRLVRQEFRLCDRCSTLLAERHVATLTDLFIGSGAARDNLQGGSLRRDPFAFRLDVYHTLVELALCCLAKAN